jgi:serine/threonine protein kinase
MSVVDGWRLGRTIGQGSFAVVREARRVDDSSAPVAAVKIFDDVFASLEKMQGIHGEIMLLESLHGTPHCAKLIDVVCDDPNSKVYVFMELAGRELTGMIEQAPGGMDEATVRTIFRQLVDAVGHLHKMSVVHRDIKPGNVLVRTDGAGLHATLVDFGLAAVSNASQERSTVCGSVSFLPPEIAAAAEEGGCTAKHDRSVDVWSAGVLLFAMLTGRLPFNPGMGQLPPQEELARIVDGEFHVPRSVPKAAAALLKGMLAPPGARISLAQVSEHPWLHNKPLKNNLNHSLKNKNNSRAGLLILANSFKTEQRGAPSAGLQCGQGCFRRPRRGRAQSAYGDEQLRQSAIASMTKSFNSKIPSTSPGGYALETPARWISDYRGGGRPRNGRRVRLN